LTVVQLVFCVTDPHFAVVFQFDRRSAFLAALFKNGTVAAAMGQK
jgi:hypothetical protein